MLKASGIAAPIASLTLLYLAALPASAAGATMPRLGTALNFAALAGSTVTSTGPSIITGNLGLDPGSALTGFPPGSVTGVTDVSNAVALGAKHDLVTAYTDAATAPVTSDLTGQNLGGKNLTPGVYKFELLRPAHRNANAERQRRLHLPGRQHSDNSEQCRGPTGEQRSSLRGVLADRKLGNAWLGYQLSGQPHGVDQHHDEHRSQYHPRSCAGARCCLDPRFERHHTSNRHVHGSFDWWVWRPWRRRRRLNSRSEHRDRNRTDAARRLCHRGWDLSDGSWSSSNDTPNLRRPIALQRLGRSARAAAQLVRFSPTVATRP